MKNKLEIVKTYTASDGTILVVYQNSEGYQNTVPLWVFKQLTKKR